jgi:hypothetical protein
MLGFSVPVRHQPGRKGKPMMAKVAAAAALLVVLSAAACSDDDDDPCDEEAALEQSVEELRNVDVVATGTDGLNAAVDNVKTDTQDLKDAVAEDLKPQVEALETAVSDAEEILSGIDNDATLNEKVDDVQEALTGVATAGSNLKEALQEECP